MFLGLSAATFDHNFGQAPPSMEFKAALASSIVAYLPNSLYLAFAIRQHEVSTRLSDDYLCAVELDLNVHDEAISHKEAPACACHAGASKQR